MKIISFLFTVVLLVTPRSLMAKSPSNCPLVPSDEQIDQQAQFIVVPIKRLTLRSTKNDYVTYEIRDRKINLLDMHDIGKGLPFTVEQPMIVAEAILELYSLGHSEAGAANGPLCHFLDPHYVHVELSFPMATAPGESYLLKISNRASTLLSFWPSGSPCRLEDMKCDLRDVIPGSLISLRDEF